jgi:hypothetical protein
VGIWTRSVLLTIESRGELLQIRLCSINGREPLGQLTIINLSASSGYIFIFVQIFVLHVPEIRNLRLQENLKLLGRFNNVLNLSTFHINITLTSDENYTHISSYYTTPCFLKPCDVIHMIVLNLYCLTSVFLHLNRR